MFEHLTEQDLQRATVLYVSRNTSSPEAPGSEPQLRRRQRDAAIVAWERANGLHDKRASEWQATLDKEHALIYKRAAERLAKIYGDKTHYIHTKAPRHQGKHTKQQKKDPIHQCKKPWTNSHHRWEPHRSGYQCMACGTRTHQGLTASVLEERLREEWLQVQIEDLRTAPSSQAEPLPKKVTRAQHIRNILAQQQAHPPGPQEHQLAETTGYLKCLKCGLNVHKRTNEAAFSAFIKSPCVDQAFETPRAGHPSHTLWQKGAKISCLQCGIQWHLDSQQRIITTQALGKQCKGAGQKGTPPISEFFKKHETSKRPEQLDSTSPEQTHDS